MLLELLDEQRRCTLLGWSQRELIAQVHAFDLLPWGVSPRARIGLLLQPGISSAVGLIAALTWHCAVPLSPAGTAEGTAAQLKTCGCTCLVASGGMAIAAKAAALAGVPLVTLAPRSAPAPEGAFEMQPPEERSGGALRTAALAMRCDDAALILHTSGTTGLSKRVVYPLRRLLDAGRAIAESLALTEDDVALNFLLFHHVGGIACNLMAPLISGGRLRCEPRFDAAAFFSAVRDTGAPTTWCYAVPAMWRKVLEFADVHSLQQLDAPSLRLARSAGADLSHADALRLARLFGPTVVILPTYAMTECMPLCSPPLTYRLQRPGSVGLPIVPLRIVDDQGAVLPPGQVGEISIVRTGEEGLLFDGYEEETPNPNPNPNEDWARRLIPTLVTTLEGEVVFQTGDRGYLDADGWLYHVGRSKEMVNRGGETIPSAEIEHMLCSHPNISEAMVFAAPHIDLGEVVAVALPLRVGPSIDVHALRKWAAGRLTHAQLPHVVVLVSELPRTSKASLRRAGYAEAIALPALSGGEMRIYTFDHTRGLLQVVERKGETAIGRCSEVLRHLSIGSEDGAATLDLDAPLAEMGVDSLGLMRIAGELHAVLGMHISPSLQHDCPTLRTLIERAQAASAAQELRRGRLWRERLPPIFGHGRPSLRAVSAERPVALPLPVPVLPHETTTTLCGGGAPLRDAPQLNPSPNPNPDPILIPTLTLPLTLPLALTLT